MGIYMPKITSNYYKYEIQNHGWSKLAEKTITWIDAEWLGIPDDIEINTKNK